MKKATMMKMRHRCWMTKRMSNRAPFGALGLAFGLRFAFGLGLAFGMGLLASGRPAVAQFSVNIQHAEHKSVPVERVATGKVVDKAGAPLGGAIVYLKNTRTNTVKTYIADNDGQFRFGDLSQDTDYALWAESEGVRSKSRGISSFDSQNNFYFTLKVDAPKTVSLDEGPHTP